MTKTYHFTRAFVRKKVSCEYGVVKTLYGVRRCAVPRGCLRFMIVVFPDHTHLLFLMLTTSCFKKANVRKKDNFMFSQCFQ